MSLGIPRRRFLQTLGGASAVGALKAAEGTNVTLAPNTNSVSVSTNKAGVGGQFINLNELIEPVRAKGKVPALAAGLIVDGKLTGFGAVGIRKGGSPVPVKGSDLWHLGSCTKAMTATVIAMQVEKRKMQWEMTIPDALPDLKEEMNVSMRDVTLRQLLNHRSGLGTHPDAKDWDLAWTQRGTPTEQRLSFIRAVLAREPEVTPGTKYIYSNQNYAIAGAMLERILNQSWENLMRELLFNPLGMTMSGFGVPGTMGQIDQPWGHKWRNGKLEPMQQDNPPAIGPGGIVHSSIFDFTRFALLHLQGARGIPRLLKAETFSILHTPPEGQTYAMGWMRQDRTWANGWTLTHNGTNTLNFAVMWLAPKINFAAVAATNIGGDNGEQTCDDAMQALIKKYAPHNS